MSSSVTAVFQVRVEDSRSVIADNCHHSTTENAASQIDLTRIRQNHRRQIRSRRRVWRSCRYGSGSSCNARCRSAGPPSARLDWDSRQHRTGQPAPDLPGPETGFPEDNTPRICRRRLGCESRPSHHCCSTRDTGRDNDGRYFAVVEARRPGAAHDPGLRARHPGAAVRRPGRPLAAAGCCPRAGCPFQTRTLPRARNEHERGCGKFDGRGHELRVLKGEPGAPRS